MLPLDNYSALQGLNKTPEITQAAARGSDQALREQTDAFESIMVKLLLDNSLKSDNALFPKSPGHDIYQSMYRDALSEEVAGSYGFSDLLFNYLKENR